jgi:hypothetical protein
LPALLGEWFPDLAVGSQAYLLDPGYHEEQVALGGEEQSLAARPVHGWVAEAAGEPVAAAFCSYEAARATMCCEYGSVSPRHRRSGIALAFAPLYGLIAQALQVETVYGLASMRHPVTQLGCERCGWELWGIVPTSERYAGAAGGVGYAPEAVYGFSLVPRATIDPRSLSPRLRALIGVLGCV